MTTIVIQRYRGPIMRRLPLLDYWLRFYRDLFLQFSARHRSERRLRRRLSRGRMPSMDFILANWNLISCISHGNYLDRRDESGLLYSTRLSIACAEMAINDARGFFKRAGWEWPEPLENWYAMAC